MQPLTVMLTGAGAPGAPGVIRSLRDNDERLIKVVGVDASSEAVGFKLTDVSYQIPLASDPSFVDRLLEIALVENAQVILPLVTSELEKLAQNKERFHKEGVIISVSDYQQLEVANNKGKLLTYMQARGFPVPGFAIVNSQEEFLQAAQDLGYPERQICFKPVQANGSRGFRIIDAKLNRYELLFEMKPTATYIMLEELLAIFADTEIFPELIVMEFLPGVEYSVDLLVDNGSPLYTIPRRRDAMNGGITTKGEIVEEHDVINYCRQIVQSLGLHGNIGIQVKRDQKNNPLILEINPRIQGTIVHCTEAGANLPYYAVKLALKEKIPQVQVAWNTKMIRYWCEVFY